MPRIPTRLLLQSYRENPLLTILLKECRSLGSARNELRWLREHALQKSSSLGHGGWQTRLKAMCRRRAKGEPLQYILGDQPFGDLEILCKRGVLIPRADTEAYTSQAAKLVQRIARQKDGESQKQGKSKSIRILDLCTGTGCIALLLHALLAPHIEDLRILGVDISPHALGLARKNLQYNVDRKLLSQRAIADVEFHKANVLGPAAESPIPSTADILPGWDSRFKASSSRSILEGCDLLISNPPYISNADFRNGTTSRSVRLFEPRLALVPPHSERNLEQYAPEDIFYHHILLQSLELKAKVTVLECGDIRQAQRVIDMHRILSSKYADDFQVDLWPKTEQELSENGFHPLDGSRGVIIQRRG